MAAVSLIDNLETFADRYTPQAAIQRLAFIASTSDDESMRVSACAVCLDVLKKTSNAKVYTKVHVMLKALLARSPELLPAYDSVWVETTTKQSAALKDLYEQDLAAAKDAHRASQSKLSSCLVESGEYAAALKMEISAGAKELGVSDSQAFHLGCMTIIRLSALVRSYKDLQTYALKAYGRSSSSSSSLPAEVSAACGLCNMVFGKYREAAFLFAQVKTQELSPLFLDVMSPEDVVLYGTLCALAGLDRDEVQAKLLRNTFFRDALDAVPKVRDMLLDFSCCRYAPCLSALGEMRKHLLLDIHLHDRVADICSQIRSRSIVQYFSPFYSVSLHQLAAAFNTDVEGMQREVVQLAGKRCLDVKIDSHQKILHARHADPRRLAYEKAMGVSQDFLDTTSALLLRMALLKHDFCVQPAVAEFPPNATDESRF